MSACPSLPVPVAARGRRPTMADVAAAAGVSTSTVSKVLNDRYGVSESTSRHVLAVIERLGYQRDLAASALRGGSTGVIGLVVEQLGAWEAAVLAGAAGEALRAGFAICVSARGPRSGSGPASMVDATIDVGCSPVSGVDGRPTVVVPPPADPVGAPPAWHAQHTGSAACGRLIAELRARRGPRSGG